MTGSGEEARVDVVELGRARLAKNRLGLQLAREMDADLLAIRALVDEVEQLRGTIAGVRAEHGRVHYCDGLWRGTPADWPIDSACPTLRLLDGATSGGTG